MMNQTGNKKVTMAIVIGVVLVIVLGFLFWLTSPTRTLNAFLTAVEEGDRDAAEQLVRGDIKEYYRDNLDFFLEDWTIADTITYDMGTEEAWIRRIPMVEDENGEMVPELNKHGDRVKEFIPTPRYWASFYHVFVDVEFDDIEDPVVIRLRRNGDNTESRFMQLFRGWKITNIDYQPLSDDELEEYGDEDYEEFDLDELEDLEFDLDELDLEDLEDGEEVEVGFGTGEDEEVEESAEAATEDTTATE